MKVYESVDGTADLFDFFNEEEECNTTSLSTARENSHTTVERLMHIFWTVMSCGTCLTMLFLGMYWIIIY